MESTNNNLPALKQVFNSYASLVDQALKRGLFQQTTQVLICHYDLESLKKIIDEQSKQQGGVNSVDSGKGGSVSGTAGETVQKRTRKKQSAKGPAEQQAAGPEPGQPAGSIGNNGVVQLNIPTEFP